jgi:hypothetical protein
MDFSYDAGYRSYQWYCQLIGSPVASFEYWMKLREEPVQKKDKAQEFIKSSGSEEPLGLDVDRTQV